MIEKYLFRLLYKKTVQESNRLKVENEMLRKELIAKGTVFYCEHKWLGRGKFIFGAVVEGETVALQELDHKG